MTFKEFETGLKQGKIPSIALLYGEESYLLERSLNLLLEKSLDPSLKDFNYNAYYGNEVKGNEIADAASTLPMFADRRVVVVKRADLLNAAVAEMLIPYILNPSETTTLILIAPKIDKRKKFFTELSKKAALVEHKPLYENQVKPFIISEVRQNGKNIDEEAADLLIFVTGSNLQELISQLEKLYIFVGKEKNITIKDVKEIVSGGKEFTPFDLSSYLGKKELKNALLALASLFRNGEETPTIIGAIASHFRKLLKIRELIDKNASQQELAKFSGVAPFFLSDMTAQSKKFSKAKLKDIFAEMSRCDVGSKSGGHPYTLMHNLVYSICAK